MAVEKCTHCECQILTEADPYVVVPYSSGYHAFCLNCIVEDGNKTHRWLINQIKLKNRSVQNG